MPFSHLCPPPCQYQPGKNAPFSNFRVKLRIYGLYKKGRTDESKADRVPDRILEPKSISTHIFLNTLKTHPLAHFEAFKSQKCLIGLYKDCTSATNTTSTQPADPYRTTHLYAARDKTRHNFRAWKPVDWLDLCSSETLIDGFWGSKIVKCSVGPFSHPVLVVY